MKTIARIVAVAAFLSSVAAVIASVWIGDWLGAGIFTVLAAMTPPLYGVMVAA